MTLIDIDVVTQNSDKWSELFYAPCTKTLVENVRERLKMILNLNCASWQIRHRLLKTRKQLTLIFAKTILSGEARFTWMAMWIVKIVTFDGPPRSSDLIPSDYLKQRVLCFIQKRIGSPCTFWTGVGINSAKGFTLTILRFRTFVVLYRKNSNSERDNGSTIKIPRFKAARAGSRISIKFYCYIQLSHILLKSVGDVSRLLN